MKNEVKTIMRIHPRSARRMKGSPVQRALIILRKFFLADPQPRIQTETARQCGELLGRHLLNLIQACGELNLAGYHASAVSLFRPLEDALDCLTAVTMIAGAADQWLSNNLRPSDAARLWEHRVKVRNAKTGEQVFDYRKHLRSILNNYAHCSPMLAYWDLYREISDTDKSRFQLRVNHENLIIEANSYRIDAYLIASCDEFLDAVTLGYSEHLVSLPKIRSEIDSLRTEIARLLEVRLKAGLLDSMVPPEIEGVELHPTPVGKLMVVDGKVNGNVAAKT